MNKLELYVEKIKNIEDKDSKPSLLEFIDEILALSGTDGLNTTAIYSCIEKAGYKHDKSVIRSYVNKNTTTSKYKHSRHLWKRTTKGNYVTNRINE